MDSSKKTSVAVTGEQGLNAEIVNQYGQLVGEFSKLDDELWLSSQAEDEGVAFCSEGRDWKIVPYHADERDAGLHLSECANKSLTDGGMTSVENNVSSLNGSSQNESSTFSSDSALQRREFSNETPFVIKQPQTKHRDPTKRYTRYVLDDTRYISDDTTDSCSDSLVRTRKITDILDLNSKPVTAWNQKQPMDVVKKCVHCGAAKTPQWRDGPEGPKTLCNACGIQYRKSLVSGCYTPLRIIKPQMQGVKKCVHCETANTPQWRDGPEGPKTLCNACGIQYRKGRPLRTPGFRSPPYKKKVKEVIMPKNNETDHNHARKQKTVMDMTRQISDLFGSDSDSDFEPMPRRKLPITEDKCTHSNTNQTPIPIRKLPAVEGRKCTHCETTETPQWREGPMGRKTLCNACGVQYRHGRLFPEYRPLLSPSYDPSLHSHLPKKVEQMRMRALCEERATAGHIVEVSKISQ